MPKKKKKQKGRKKSAATQPGRAVAATATLDQEEGLARMPTKQKEALENVCFAFTDTHGA